MNDGPIAIVTGAGSGIGRETAILLAHAGYAVALVGRTEAKLVETQSRIGGEDCLVISADLCNAGSADWIVERTMSRFGRVDALCNVAGDASLMPIEQVTPEAWRRCIDTNLSCIVHLTAKLLPVISKKMASGFASLQCCRKVSRSMSRATPSSVVTSCLPSLRRTVAA